MKGRSNGRGPLLWTKTGVYVQGEIDLSMVYEPETLGDEEAGLQRVEWPGAPPPLIIMWS